MSEIYNGSFVLGNTSATTISAGPGIKIDDSTPGVIKVSNDETVLWETTANAKTTAFTVSQPLTAFEKIRYEVTGYTHVYAECTQNSPTANNEEIGICFTYYCNASDANPMQIVGGSYSSNNGLDYGLTRSKFLYMANNSNVWYNNQTDGPHLQKIVGINRKQNGGN